MRAKLRMVKQEMRRRMHQPIPEQGRALSFACASHPIHLWATARVWARERPHRQNITVRRRDDADDALRSGPEHAGAFGEMVLAQGLGDEDCQASRDEEGNRGASASAGRDHASHLG
jgi:hypothetical protein